MQIAQNSYQKESAIPQNYKYNDGAERQFDLGLNVDFTKFRTYDPVLGRWWQVDPLADQEDLVNRTPYNYSFNNPIRYNDPEGDCPTCPVINVITKYAVIASGAKASTQRLLNRTSGATPSNIGMSEQTRTTIKTTGIVGDANQIADTGNKLVKEAVLDTGETLDKTGEIISDVGVLAAPLTEGVSLGLVPIGEGMSVAGKTIKAAVHLSEGNVEGAIEEGANLVVGAVTNTVTGTAIKQSKKVGLITNAKEEAIQEAVLGGTSSVVNKTSGVIIDEIDDEQKR